MDEFYGPPFDFRPTPRYLLELNYYTNPFIDSYEKIELGQWLAGLPPTYGEWYYQWAERNGLENEGSTTQPNEDDSLMNEFISFVRKSFAILFVGLVVYGLYLIPKNKK